MSRLIEDSVLDDMEIFSPWCEMMFPDEGFAEFQRGWNAAVQAAKERIRNARTIISAKESEHGD